MIKYLSLETRGPVSAISETLFRQRGLGLTARSVPTWPPSLSHASWGAVSAYIPPTLRDLEAKLCSSTREDPLVAWPLERSVCHPDGPLQAQTRKDTGGWQRFAKRRNNAKKNGKL